MYLGWCEGYSQGLQLKDIDSPLWQLPIGTPCLDAAERLCYVRYVGGMSVLYGRE